MHIRRCLVPCTVPLHIDLYNTANIGWLLFFPTMAFPGINVDAGASAKKLFVCAADDDQILNDMDVIIDVRLQTSLPAKLAHISPFVCDSRPDPKPKKIKEAKGLTKNSFIIKCKSLWNLRIKEWDPGGGGRQINS